TPVNEVGNAETFTITVNALPAGTGTPAFGTPVVSFPGGAPVTVGAVSAPVLSNGGNTATYTVAINNPTAGTFTINASDAVTFGSGSGMVTVTRDTDQATATIPAGPGGSGPATKTYVDASIALSPATSTNAVDQPHQ